MRTIKINLKRGKEYSVAPTKVIYQRLLSTGKINPGDPFKASYSSRTGEVNFIIDETVTNLSSVRTEARKFEQDDREMRT